MRELLADIADWWADRPCHWVFRPIEAARGWPSFQASDSELLETHREWMQASMQAAIDEWHQRYGPEPTMTIRIASEDYWPDDADDYVVSTQPLVVERDTVH